MGQIIKQSTALTVAIGPFVDSTDGFTAKTALSITQPDIRLSKNGAAFAQKNTAQTLSHMENGYYSLSLDTTDTGTVGILTVHCIKSTALPVFHEFQVVVGTVYDALFGSSATGALPVSSGGIASTAFASGAITSSAIASGAVTSAAYAAGAINAAALGTDAITAAKIATDAIGAAELATDGVTEITNAVLAALKDQDRRGTAQGAGSGSDTLVLAVGDLKADSFYTGALVVILDGSGSTVPVAQRTRRIIGYVNSTNQIQVDAAWSVAPTSSTVYLITGG